MHTGDKSYFKNGCPYCKHISIDATLEIKDSKARLICASCGRHITIILSLSEE